MVLRHHPQFPNSGAHFGAGKPWVCPIALQAGWGGMNHCPATALLCLLLRHPWGFRPVRESALPSPKQSGDWLINHGIFMKTSGSRLGGGVGPLAAADGSFLVTKNDALPFPQRPRQWVSGQIPSPSSSSPWSLCHPPASFAKTSQQHPKVPGGAQGLSPGAVLPPRPCRAAASWGHLQLLSLLKVNPINCRELFWH